MSGGELSSSPVHEAPLHPSRGRTSRASISDPSEALVTVTDLAQELGISARALRFYEDKGLIAPRRVAAARVYSSRERARMILVLRGKQLGFSLREIKAYLDLYDADPRHQTQTEALLTRIAERRGQLERQRRAIDDALRGLDELERDSRNMPLRPRGKRTFIDATARRHQAPRGSMGTEP